MISSLAKDKHPRADVWAVGSRGSRLGTVDGVSCEVTKAIAFWESDTRTTNLFCV
ncbi:hypothetical protein IQ244_23565 [Nostoc sp. LEGE 06077]|uniref:hypothetical protein n=1 Tax=Nostoc sp. LEGE 06077 TaxID=915325 RepID=UPI00187E7D10|nr:hypothetical protein [Nostoc sp. LEGE 06077]MBE9209424.1 hypothetical protein [Nostoc sp. LEGE 06077]